MRRIMRMDIDTSHHLEQASDRGKLDGVILVVSKFKKLRKASNFEQLIRVAYSCHISKGSGSLKAPKKQKYPTYR